MGKMKKMGMALLLIWSLGFGVASVKAQTAAEFLRQKKTQEKYLIKQLAYLELYSSEIRKGYELAKEGLGTIKGFTNGEFKLHEAFFDALATVSSVVRKDFRVVEIAKMQVNIRSSLGALVESSALPQALKEYIREVQKTVIEACDEDLNELLDIVLSGKVEMDDEARLERLKLVYEAMKEKAAFTRYFCAEVQGLLINQRGYEIDLESIRRFYEKH